MPLYKKKYSRTGKPYYKKRRGNIYARRTVNKADKALKLASYAVRSLNVEVKSKLLSETGTAIGTGGTTFNLASIAQGDTFNNRDGRSVKLTQINIKGTIALDPAAQASRVRILIIHKIDNSLTAPVGTDILDNTIFNSLRNLNNTDNIRVLSDKRYTLDQATNLNKAWSFNRKLSMRQQYKIGVATGGATDLERSGLYLFAFSDQAVNFPTLTFQARTRFVDN